MFWRKNILQELQKGLSFPKFPIVLESERNLIFRPQAREAVCCNSKDERAEVGCVLPASSLAIDVGVVLHGHGVDVAAQLFTVGPFGEKLMERHAAVVFDGRMQGVAERPLVWNPF